MFTGELFEMNEVDKELVRQKIGVDREAIKPEWDKTVHDVCQEALLIIPTDGDMITGGRQGIHTEHLGHLLSDMQYLQRAYPNAAW